jgi:NAD(P)-dependent dehydrogenase (short-subunit alcohol dehydrogenase family)
VRDVLRGKRCLITGATGGLGKEIAREFAASGAHLFLTSRDASRLVALSRTPEIIAATARIAPADLASREGVDGLVTAVMRELDGLDILVNCAGVFPIGGISEIDADELDRCLFVNVRAPILLARAFSPGMVARRWGRIVNIGSSSSYAGFRQTVTYCATKHALLGFSRALHDELKEHGVRSICVSPGSIRTEMGKKLVAQDDSTFLDPRSVAAFVVDVSSVDDSMSVEEVRLNRMEVR